MADTPENKDKTNQMPKGKEGEDNEDPKTGLDKQKISESFMKLFEGLELTESFKTQANTLFMASIHEQEKFVTDAVTETVTAKLESEYADKLDKETSAISERVDSYLTHAVRTFIDENAVAIDEGMRVEAAEKVLESTKQIAESYGLELSDAEHDAVALAEAKVTETTESLDESIKREVALSAEVKQLNATIVLNKLTEGMILTDADRLRTLSESVDFVDAESFTASVQTLKEGVTVGVPAKTNVPASLDEGVVVIKPTIDENQQVQVKHKRRF